MNPAISPALRRLSDAQETWKETMDAYYDPDTFRRKINSCLQELRNVTFILQSNKKEIEGFEEWYKPWQDKMRNNKSLQWSLHSRNTVVKQRDLETFSTLKFEIIGSYLSDEFFSFEEMFNPELTIDGIYKKINQRNIPDKILYNSTIRLRRRWIDKSLPSEEIGELLANSWVFLANLLQNVPGVKAPDVKESEINNHLLPPCMHQKLKNREKYLKITKDGLLPSTIVSKSIVLNMDNLNEAKESYKETPFFSQSSQNLLLSKNFHEKCSFIFKQAKAILQKDKYHIQISLIFKSNEIVEIKQMLNEDRSEKYISMQKLASDMECIGADALIMISEAWIRKSLEDEPDGESLNLIGANKTGEIFVFISQFYRDPNNEITFDPNPNDEVIFDPNIKNNLQRINIIQPIIDMWKKQTISEDA